MNTVADDLASKRKLIGARELAEVLNIDKQTIWRMAKRGLLPSVRLGGRVRFDPRAIADWLREHTAG